MHNRKSLLQQKNIVSVIVLLLIVGLLYSAGRVWIKNLRFNGPEATFTQEILDSGIMTTYISKDKKVSITYPGDWKFESTNIPKQLNQLGQVHESWTIYHIGDSSYSNTIQFLILKINSKGLEIFKNCSQYQGICEEVDINNQSFYKLDLNFLGVDSNFLAIIQDENLYGFFISTLTDPDINSIINTFTFL